MRRTDLLSLAAGLVFSIVSAYFLVVDDPDVRDVAHIVGPVVLFVAGATLLIGSALRRPE